MNKLILLLSVFLISSPLYAQQYDQSSRYQNYGMLMSINPFGYYYPGFIPGPPDFDPIPDTARNRRLYPGLFELQRFQEAELRRIQKRYPIPDMIQQSNPNRF